MFNVNLGTIGGVRPLPALCLRPCYYVWIDRQATQYELILLCDLRDAILVVEEGESRGGGAGSEGSGGKWRA